MAAVPYTYVLGDPHDNQLDGNGLPCDGTVSVRNSDPVCYATVTFSYAGNGYEQKIMNVPYQDADRLPLYLDYFVNDQCSQLGA